MTSVKMDPMIAVIALTNVTKTPSPVAEYWLPITTKDEPLKPARQEFATGQWIEVEIIPRKRT